MKRRLIAWLGLILAVGGFIVLALAIHLGINFLVPIGMIAASFALLTIAKRMPSDLDAQEQDKSDENGGGDEA